MTIREKLKIPNVIKGCKVVSVKQYNKTHDEKPYIVVQYAGTPTFGEDNPDEEIEKIMKKAGYESTGSGFCLINGYRDISFEKIKKKPVHCKKAASLAWGK